MGGREKGKQAKEKRSILDPSSSQDTGPLMIAPVSTASQKQKEEKTVRDLSYPLV